MFRAGDQVSRIGGESVEGVVVRVVVSMGEQSILAVKVGDAVRNVSAAACEPDQSAVETIDERDAFNVPLDLIPRDGATMPCADGVDVVALSN